MKKTTFLATLTIASTITYMIHFPQVVPFSSTFSKAPMDGNATLLKYKNDWDSTTIHHTKQKQQNFKVGDIVGTITIPKMEIYELPVYNGASETTNNHHITTPGHLGNYALFGEQGVSVVGAHNYQLFKNLPSLQKGDKILIETSIDRYVYVVEGTAIYHHKTDDWNTLATKHSKDYSLNLMTCYPIDALKTEDMYIVYTYIQKGTLFE